MEGSSYGLLIADADTASIYYADLAGDGIVTAKVGNLTGADYISSLYGVSVPGASDDSDASEQIRHVMALAESANASQDVGDALTASGVVSLRTELTETEVTGETAQLDVVQKGDELANVSTGSLNAVQPQSVTPSTVEDGRSIVTVTIADDVAVTNGKYTVTYDPSKLTFRGLSSAAQVKSYLADEEKGIVTFAFASEEAVAAGNTLATLTFTYSGCDVTSVTVAASERNDGAASDSKVSTILYGTSPSTPAGPTEPEFPFKDVTTDHPFYEDIQYVYEKGLMQGVSEDIFQSGATTTRGMIATILYRMEGEPAVSGSNPFPDVADGSYCDDATIWAAGCGVVKGYADGTFRPDQTISREQMAAILYRYAQYKGCDVSVGEDTNILSYTDAAQVATYAVPAFQWAVGAGIINGTTATTLSPKGSATRGQVAAILPNRTVRIAVPEGHPAQGVADYPRFFDPSHADQIASAVRRLNASTYLPKVTSGTTETGALALHLQHTFNWVVGATDDQVAAEVSQFIMATVAMMNQLDIMFPDQWTKEGTNA